MSQSQYRPQPLLPDGVIYCFVAVFIVASSSIALRGTGIEIVRWIAAFLCVSVLVRVTFSCLSPTSLAFFRTGEPARGIEHASLTFLGIQRRTPLLPRMMQLAAVGLLLIAIAFLTRQAEPPVKRLGSIAGFRPNTINVEPTTLSFSMTGDSVWFRGYKFDYLSSLNAQELQTRWPGGGSAIHSFDQWTRLFSTAGDSRQKGTQWFVSTVLIDREEASQSNKELSLPDEMAKYAISDDGRIVAFANESTDSVACLSLETHQLLWSRHDLFMYHLKSFELSPRGELLILGPPFLILSTRDGSIALSTDEIKKLNRELDPRSDDFEHWHFAQSPHHLIARNERSPPEVHVITLAGDGAATSTAIYNAVDANVSPTGQLLAIASVDHVKICRLPTMESLWSKSMKNTLAVAFSPNGDLLAVATDVGPVLFQLNRGLLPE